MAHTITFHVSDNLEELKTLYPTFSIWEWEGEKESPLQGRYVALPNINQRAALPGADWWEVDY